MTQREEELMVSVKPTPAQIDAAIEAYLECVFLTDDQVRDSVTRIVTTAILATPKPEAERELYQKFSDAIDTIEAIGARASENEPSLLPCPFCGGKAEHIDIEEGENAGGSCICCTACQASGNVEFGRKENFISNWNRRAALATPKPEAEPEESVATVAEIGAGGHRWLVPHPLSALDHLPIGTPLYAHPPKPEATEGGEHEKGIEAAREACLDCDFVVPTSVLRKAIAAYLNETEVGK